MDIVNESVEQELLKLVEEATDFRVAQRDIQENLQ